MLRGERLVVLRDLRGLTQGELANRLDVTQSFVSHMEKGSRPVPAGVAEAAAAAYSLPITFFSITNGVSDIGQHTFRKKARASARDERRVRRLHDEAARLFHEVSSLTGYRELDLPDPRDHHDDPEECAEALREVVGLSPDEPVLNMCRLIERRGIGVITRLDDTEVDASDHVGVSKPTRFNRRPLVALTRPLPGAVQRLSLAHELGHLVFDQDLASPVVSTRSAVEIRAFRFAGALLLPERVARQRLTASLSLHGYLRVKADYGVSVGALVRRAKELGIISPERYRSLTIQLSSQGWRSNEPVAVAAEEPQLLGQGVDKVAGDEAHPRRSGKIGSRVDWASRRFGVDVELVARWIPELPPRAGGGGDAAVIPFRARTLRSHPDS